MNKNACTLLLLAVTAVFAGCGGGDTGRDVGAAAAATAAADSGSSGTPDAKASELASGPASPGRSRVAAQLRPPTPAPAPAPLPAAPSASVTGSCEASAGARSVTDFGSFVANGFDDATRSGNTAVLNRALDEVGRQAGGGAVCLPAGSYFLTNRVNGDEALVIARDNVSLWGKGMSAAEGGTRLVTRSAWSLDANGQVRRGFGIRLRGTSSPAAPLSHVTLRDFELDGGAGYTGEFGWPANTTTGDGWDLSHKGIILASDDCVNDVKLERIWTHSYRGEVIYAGGQCLQKVTVDGIRSEDTNASTFNVTANLTVSNSFFGRSSMWMELGAAGPYNSSTWTHNRFQNAARFGIAIAQGDLRPDTPHVFDSNSFENCGESAFYLGGGSGGPVRITRNTFIRCAGVFTGYAPNPAPWAREENQLLTFENNLMTNVAYMAQMYGTLNDSVFRGNHIVNDTGNVGLTTATLICVSNYRNVTVENNVFDNTRTPEQSCGISSGERPLYRGNAYNGSEWREGQASTSLSKSQRVIRPLFEYGYARVDLANMVAQLDTARYPDGQIFTLWAGTSAKPLRFAVGQASYHVAAPRVLTGGSISFRYNKAQRKWIEITGP